jgi:hypothetical protein
MRIREFDINEWRILYTLPVTFSPRLFYSNVFFVRQPSEYRTKCLSKSHWPRGMLYLPYSEDSQVRLGWVVPFPSESSSSRVSRTQGSASPSELKQASVCTCKLPRLWKCHVEHRWLTVVRKSNRNKTLAEVYCCVCIRGSYWTLNPLCKNACKTYAEKEMCLLLWGMWHIQNSPRAVKFGFWN